MRAAERSGSSCCLYTIQVEPKLRSVKTYSNRTHSKKNRSTVSSWLVTGCISLLLVGCFSSNAGTIHLSATGPSPSLLNVLTHEPVIFIADDEGPYAVLSYNWAAGTISLPHQGSTGSVTLAFSGTYNYQDGRGHYGIIYVNIPPTCKITNPTNNAVFAAPASFDFTEDARDTDEDRLMGVDFWLGTTYLDGRIYSPFRVPISNLGPGTYVLTAIAVDYGEGAATNSVTITVQAPTLLLSNARKSGGQFVFDVSGVTAGKSARTNCPEVSRRSGSVQPAERGARSNPRSSRRQEALLSSFCQQDASAPEHIHLVSRIAPKFGVNWNGIAKLIHQTYNGYMMSDHLGLKTVQE